MGLLLLGAVLEAPSTKQSTSESCFERWCGTTGARRAPAPTGSPGMTSGMLEFRVSVRTADHRSHWRPWWFAICYLTNSVSCEARRVTGHDQGHRRSGHQGTGGTANPITLPSLLNANVRLRTQRHCRSALTELGLWNPAASCGRMCGLRHVLRRCEWNSPS